MPNTTIISNELQILPYLNGVRLIRPEQQQKFLHRSAVVTLQELDAQPFTIYFTDKNHALMTANQALAKITGYDSIKPLCGYSIEKVIRNQEQITKTHTNNNIVIQSRRPFIFDESTDLNSKEVIKPISFKMPWYDDFNNIIGFSGDGQYFSMK